MQGDTLVRTFLVSTGTWLHPTVTGTFYIYVKYRFANMAGPGYYLPNVPYVMYFYKGYGLHGTYWHHNFGHPMSHGCVNLSNCRCRLALQLGHSRHGRQRTQLTQLLPHTAYQPNVIGNPTSP